MALYKCVYYYYYYETDGLDPVPTPAEMEKTFASSLILAYFLHLAKRDKRDHNSSVHTFNGFVRYFWNIRRPTLAASSGKQFSAIILVAMTAISRWFSVTIVEAHAQRCSVNWAQKPSIGSGVRLSVCPSISAVVMLTATHQREHIRRGQRTFWSDNME